MPPLPPVPNVLKVAFKGKYSSGYNWANVQHWLYSGSAPSDPTCRSLAEDFYNAYSTAFVGDMPSIQSFESVSVVDLSSSTAGQGEYVLSTPGTSTGDKLPGNVATLVSKLVAARYRGGHPRTYLPCGTDENLLDQGHWNSAYVAHIGAVYETFLGTMIGDAEDGTTIDQEVAVSYYETDYTTTPPSRVRRSVPLVYRIFIDGYTVNAEIASQRRRIGRRR